MGGCSLTFLVLILTVILGPVGFWIGIFFALLFLDRNPAASEAIQNITTKSNNCNFDDFDDDFDEYENSSYKSYDKFLDAQDRKKDRAYERSLDWVKKVFSNKEKYVILDTETTGLSDRDEILEIGVIDLDGRTLFHSFVRPPKRRKIPEKAVSIHGITLDRLKSEPTMTDIHQNLRIVLDKKIVIAYNAEFDKQMLSQTLGKYDLPAIKNKYECAMLKYTAFCLRERWLKLPGAGHDTITDCNAVRAILNEMNSSAF